jgi:hypothetical protein
MDERTVEIDRHLEYLTKRLIITWKKLYRCSPRKKRHQKLKDRADYLIDKINERKIKCDGHDEPLWFIELHEEFLKRY